MGVCVAVLGVQRSCFVISCVADTEKPLALSDTYGGSFSPQLSPVCSAAGVKGRSGEPAGWLTLLLEDWSWMRGRIGLWVGSCSLCRYFLDELFKPIFIMEHVVCQCRNG